MSDFGKVMARCREEAGLNQRQLAAAIGLDATQINKIERGHRPPLGAKYMKPLVCALRLNQNEALNLVDLAGHSPKVLEIEDRVQTPRYPRLLRKKGAHALKSEQPTQTTSTASDVLAATGTFGAPSSLGDDQEQQIPPFEEQVRQLLTSFHLPYAKRMIAQQMSLEAIRIICWGLTEVED